MLELIKHLKYPLGEENNDIILIVVIVIIIFHFHNSGKEINIKLPQKKEEGDCVSNTFVSSKRRFWIKTSIIILTKLLPKFRILFVLMIFFPVMFI